MNSSRQKDDGTSKKAAPPPKAVEEDKEKEQFSEPVRQSVMMQLLKDALLRKIQSKMQTEQPKGKLMPKNMSRLDFKSTQIPSMIGKLNPYHIRYKSLAPKFKIDSNTFRILSNDDEEEKLQQDGASKPSKSNKVDPNLLTIRMPPKFS